MGIEKYHYETLCSRRARPRRGFLCGTVFSIATHRENLKNCENGQHTDWLPWQKSTSLMLKTPTWGNASSMYSSATKNVQGNLRDYERYGEPHRTQNRHASRTAKTVEHRTKITRSPRTTPQNSARRRDHRTHTVRMCKHGTPSPKALKRRYHQLLCWITKTQRCNNPIHLPPSSYWK